MILIQNIINMEYMSIVEVRCLQLMKFISVFRGAVVSLRNAEGALVTISPTMPANVDT